MHAYAEYQHAIADFSRFFTASREWRRSRSKMADRIPYRRSSGSSAGAKKVASTFALNTGRCITCRQELRKKRNPFNGDGYYDVPLTVENRVYKGRCLLCNPFSHSDMDGRAVQEKVSRGNKQLRSASMSSAFYERQEADRDYHARLNSYQSGFAAHTTNNRKTSAVAERKFNHHYQGNNSHIDVLAARPTDRCSLTVPLEIDIKKKPSGFKRFFQAVFSSPGSRESSKPVQSILIPSQAGSDDESLGMSSWTPDHHRRK
jgi:hypothetical protein